MENKNLTVLQQDSILLLSNIIDTFFFFNDIPIPISIPISTHELIILSVDV